MVFCTVLGFWPVILFSIERQYVISRGLLWPMVWPVASWWLLVCDRWPVVCCAVLVALSLGLHNAPKIDFKAHFRRLLSLGNGRVAWCIKKPLKSLILKCKCSLCKHCQKNTGLSGRCIFGGIRCLWHAVDQYPKLMG